MILGKKLTLAASKLVEVDVILRQIATGFMGKNAWCPPVNAHKDT